MTYFITSQIHNKFSFLSPVYSHGKTTISNSLFSIIFFINIFNFGTNILRRLQFLAIKVFSSNCYRNTRKTDKVYGFLQCASLTFVNDLTAQKRSWISQSLWNPDRAMNFTIAQSYHRLVGRCTDTSTCLHLLRCECLMRLNGNRLV